MGGRRVVRVEWHDYNEGIHFDNNVSSWKSDSFDE